MDLNLVPIDDPIKEIERRSQTLVLAYQTYEDNHKSELKSYYGKGAWSKAIALASMLDNDVLNNWNGELQVLQRIAIEED